MSGVRKGRARQRAATPLPRSRAAAGPAAAAARDRCPGDRRRLGPPGTPGEARRGQTAPRAGSRPPRPTRARQAPTGRSASSAMAAYAPRPAVAGRRAARGARGGGGGCDLGLGSRWSWAPTTGALTLRIEARGVGVFRFVPPARTRHTRRMPPHPPVRAPLPACHAPCAACARQAPCGEGEARRGPQARGAPGAAAVGRPQHMCGYSCKSLVCQSA